MSRPQISLEMVAAVALVILIFIGFYIFYIDKNRQIRNLDHVIELRNECFRISNAIESAITLGDGYSSILRLRANYTARLTSGVIDIVAPDGVDTSCSYRGNVVSGTYNSTLNISNTNNVVRIQNV